jgi:hypothetical protein
MNSTNFYIDRIYKRTGRTVSMDCFPRRVKCEGCPAKNKSVLMVRVNGTRRHLCAECRGVLDTIENQDSRSGMAA